MSVQVLEGRVGNFEGLQAQLEAWMTVYDTSEGEAPANATAAPTSDEGRAGAERLRSLLQVDRYVDLPVPMLYSR